MITVDAPLTITNKIVSAVCDYFNTTKDIVFGGSHQEDIVYHRRLCFYLIHHETGKSFLSIGKMFGVTRETVRRSIGNLEHDKEVFKWVKRDFDNLSNAIDS